LIIVVRIVHISVIVGIIDNIGLYLDFLSLPQENRRAENMGGNDALYNLFNFTTLSKNRSYSFPTLFSPLLAF